MHLILQVENFNNWRKWKNSHMGTKFQQHVKSRVLILEAAERNSVRSKVRKEVCDLAPIPS